MKARKGREIGAESAITKLHNERYEKEKIVIELKNVHKIYDMGEGNIVKALQELSMHVHNGEHISILGPSGSGKSTLLHMIGLLDVPTSGMICLDGHCVDELSEDERAYVRGKKIGFVFQTFNLVNSLTALENVMLPMMIYNVPKDEREDRAIVLLEQLGMEDRIGHKPSELSGGQRQRVAIARALANDPPIILADEPTGNLDSKTGQEVIEIFDDLHKRGKTLLIVTHNVGIAERADKILHMKDGMIIKEEIVCGKACRAGE